jgi:aminoglycoside phosphotransferase family enzyme
MTTAPSQDSEPVETDTRVMETHISTLFFLCDRVYKLKKMVRTGFLDWSTPDRRRQACLLEVALNSRLAPDVYLGTADIVDSEGKLCDSLVVMRRLPSSRRLSRMILDGVDVTPELRSLARQLAGFHSGCRHGPEIAVAGRPNVVLDNWRQNCVEMAPFARRGLVDQNVLDEVARLSESYVRGRGELFQRRVDGGRGRDGHGDLLADDISCSTMVPGSSTVSNSTLVFGTGMSWLTWPSWPWTWSGLAPVSRPPHFSPDIGSSQATTGLPLWLITGSLTGRWCEPPWPAFATSRGTLQRRHRPPS